jgi:hypothetical protein
LEKLNSECLRRRVGWTALSGGLILSNREDKGSAWRFS